MYIVVDLGRGDLGKKKDIHTHRKIATIVAM
jgi:hypothetical protein